MPEQRLRKDLERLCTEIESLDSADLDAVSRLQRLAERVQTELDEEQGISDPADLIDELEDSVTAFEASHPNLTAIVNNVIVLLGSMGV